MLFVPPLRAEFQQTWVHSTSSCESLFNVSHTLKWTYHGGSRLASRCRALEWSSCIPCFSTWDDRSGGRPPVAGFKDYGASGDWSGNQSLGAIEPRQHPFDSIYIEKLGCPNPQQVLSYPGYFCQGSRWEGADLVHFGGHPGYPGLIIFFIFFHPWEICWIMMSPGSHVPCVLNALNCVVWVYGIGRIHCFPQGKTNTNLNNYKRNSHVNTNTSESES